MKFLAGENLEDRVSDYTYSGAVDHGGGQLLYEGDRLQFRNVNYELMTEWFEFPVRFSADLQ